MSVVITVLVLGVMWTAVAAVCVVLAALVFRGASVGDSRYGPTAQADRTPLPR